jgi:arylsulfatase A-like enzyme
MMGTSVSPQSESRSPDAVRGIGPLDVLVLSAWCGLAGGELEVAARIAYRALSSTQRLYLMTRHFVWLVPLVNLALFLALGGLLVLARRVWPRQAGWWGPRMIIALAIFQVLFVAGRRIYPEAWLLVALGVAFQIAPVLQRYPLRARHLLVGSVPLLLGLVLLQAGWIFGIDRMKQWREASRPLPTAGSANVLLIVLDTVRADHLSLYGYPRPTTPSLERLARRGIRFDQARAAAPWTLASHATMFTGRWPHDLGIGWSSPLEGDAMTLAEHLGSLGYATAGFVGNTDYCAYDSGLSRGFTHYRDYVFDALNAARTVRLVSELMKAVGKLGRFLPSSGLPLLRLSYGERKDAHVVNREFLDWLSDHREHRRPFFAFLNYVDAHSPYLLPPGGSYHLGTAPESDDDLRFLAEGWSQADKRRIPDALRQLAIDAYDNCLAYLDERLGELIDDLQRRGVLDETLVIVTADHGEGMGEHGLYDHGESLYRPEIRVPLLLVLPTNRGRPPMAVNEFVSLRDIAATVAEYVHPGTGSPFPGRSLLARRATAAKPAEDGELVVRSELASPNPTEPNQGRSPAARGPLVSLAAADFVYIRNEGDGTEELFNEREDPREIDNRAGAAATLPVLRRFRAALVRANDAAPEVKQTRVATTPNHP